MLTVFMTIMTITGGLYVVLTVIATIKTITGKSVCSVNSCCAITGRSIFSANSYCGTSDNNKAKYMQWKQLM